MKFFLLLISTFFVGISCTEGPPEQAMHTTANETSFAENTVKKYLVRSGMIQYRVDGMLSGTETLWWDDYGRVEARYTEQILSVGGMTQTQKSYVINKHEHVYTVNREAGTATHAVNPVYRNLRESTSADNMVSLGEQMIRRMGGEMAGNQEFLGKLCDVWEVPDLGSMVWVWKGLTLKSTTELSGMGQNLTATQLETLIEVDPTHFDLTDLDIREIAVPGQ